MSREVADRGEVCNLCAMHIEVATYPGHRGMLMPQGFELGDRWVEVVDTIDQWFGPDYRYIKVRGDDDGLYILRVQEPHATWQLTMFATERAHTVVAGRAGRA